MKVKVFREMLRVTVSGHQTIVSAEGEMSAFVSTVNVKFVHQTSVSSSAIDGNLYITTIFSVWYEEPQIQ